MALEGGTRHAREALKRASQSRLWRFISPNTHGAGGDEGAPENVVIATTPERAHKYAMRLFEFSPPTLFLCTNTPQEIGEVVTLDEPLCYLSAAVENVLEAQRPATHIPRQSSILLHCKPQNMAFTYTVEPVGQLERQNVAWLSKLADCDPSLSGVMAHYANGYWSGGECPEARNEPWEYRAKAVKVVSRFGGSATEI